MFVEMSGHWQRESGRELVWIDSGTEEEDNSILASPLHIQDFRRQQTFVSKIER
jgi:hypothetical protein